MSHTKRIYNKQPIREKRENFITYHPYKQLMMNSCHWCKPKDANKKRRNLNNEILSDILEHIDLFL